jgi:hypothetical protein
VDLEEQLQRLARSSQVESWRETNEDRGQDSAARTSRAVSARTVHHRPVILLLRGARYGDCLPCSA